MELKYKITKKEAQPIEVGMKDDIGLITIVDYELWNGTQFIGNYHSHDENISQEDLTSHYIQYLIENNITEIMEKIKVPEEDFFTQICEDDFFTNTVHDLRNPKLYTHPETPQHGRALNGVYHRFIKQHLNKVEEVLE